MRCIAHDGREPLELIMKNAASPSLFSAEEAEIASGQETEGGGSTRLQAITPPLKWHGGKYYLAKRIVAMIPPHTTYVEPYAGGLTVLLAKEAENSAEVINDLNRDLVRFWRVLADQAHFGQFQRFIECVPFSEWHWDHVESIRAGEYASGYDPEVCHAVAFYVMCRLSLAGRMKNFAPLTKNRLRRKMNEQASAWMGAVDGLAEVHQRLRRVAILNDDATDVIRKMDGPATVVYADPPYVHATRVSTDAYAFEMTEAEHIRLLEALASLQGHFLLSGYRSPLYDEFAKQNEWHVTEFELPNNAARGEAKRRMVECVWTNYDPKAISRG